MTQESAEKAATLIIAAAAVGAAVVVIRTPQLRRLAWNLARTAVTVTLPAWISREVQQAWADSAARQAR